MKKHKLLVIGQFPENGIKILKEYFETEISVETDIETIKNKVRDVDAIIVRTSILNKEIIDNANCLKVIGRFGTGYDNIDIGLCCQRKIPVVFTPGAGSRSVAEHVVGFILALAKKMMISREELRKGNWNYRNNILSQQVKGKILGIFGGGKIGSQVAKICGLGLEMDVRIYDPFLSQERVSEMGARIIGSKEELLRIADFVTLHIPLSDETEHYIGEKEFKLMKPTAYLVNAARGLIVDEEALIDALKNHIIAGAAIDVYIKEPVDSSNPLLKMENVIATPHMSGLTQDGVNEVVEMVCEGVIDVIEGKKPRWIINEEVLY